MKYNVVIKKEKFPNMSDKERIIFSSIEKNTINSDAYKEELNNLGLTTDDVDIKKDIDFAIDELNQQRDKELKGFVIDNIFMNEDIIKTMAVAYNIAADNETIEWIDINNKVVKFTKADFGALIKQGSNKVKEIYFKYRNLKDELLNEN